MRRTGSSRASQRRRARRKAGARGAVAGMHVGAQKALCTWVRVESRAEVRRLRGIMRSVCGGTSVLLSSYNGAGSGKWQSREKGSAAHGNASLRENTLGTRHRQQRRRLSSLQRCGCVSRRSSRRNIAHRIRSGAHWSIVGRGCNPRRAGLRVRRNRPCLVTVKEKLPAQQQKPEPERKTQRPPRNVRTQQRASNRASHASSDQLQQQMRIRSTREPVRAAADQ